MTPAAPARFHWRSYPKAETFLRAALDDAWQRTPDADQFRKTLLETCGVRLRDILDHVALPAGSGPPPDAGWQQIETNVWRHFGGAFPDIVERENACIAFRVESIDHFLRTLGIETPVEGAPHGPYRRARVFSGRGVAFDAVERNGWVGFEMPGASERRIRRARLHQQMFRTRRRQFRSTERGLSQTQRLIDAAVADLGPHWACALFMRAEREYWAAHCDAGAVQKRRQDAAGVGWCNVDHDAYECSREHFHRVVGILEALGYERREVVRAGEHAGWGSQILEQPALRSTIAANIDLAPHETSVALPLSPLTLHSQAGLWSAMHGESILEAGLRHVAGLYHHRTLQRQLGREGVAMMDPVFATPHLVRARTHGQFRPVDPRRVDTLERGGYLTRSEAEGFRLNGAVAGHLESVERSDGFKGFAPAVPAAAASQSV